MMNQAELFWVKLENVAPLPEETLLEILVYLPVKALIRFTSISKYWCGLIKSPTFVTKHLNCDRKETILLKRYLPPENSIRDGGENFFSFHNPYSPNLFVSPNLPIPFLNGKPEAEFIQLLGPCNGLVCLVLGDTIILCNPALREFKLISPSPFAYPDGYVRRILGSGFGFDSNSNSYKCVQIYNIEENVANFFMEDEEFYNRHEDFYVRAELFDLSTNSWRLIDTVVPSVCYSPGFDLFFNGFCHWKAEVIIEEPPCIGKILSFDVETEVFQQFEYPDFFDKKYPSLIVLNQYLALVRHGAWTNEPQAIDFWVMKEYGVKESWIKELIIVPYLFRRPFFSWKNEWLLVEDGEGQLAYCSIHANEIKTFEIYGFPNSLRAVIFTETTLSLNQVNLNCTKGLV